MHKPKMFAGNDLGQLSLEIGLLFVVTVIMLIYLFNLHWILAVGLSPFAVLLVLAAVAMLVQLMWMVVVGADRLAGACGIRKSPLS
jgi:hypothetical protein